MNIPSSHIRLSASSLLVIRGAPLPDRRVLIKPAPSLTPCETTQTLPVFSSSFFTPQLETPIVSNLSE